MTSDINRCPTCYQTKVVKRGKRTIAFGEVQLYQCRNCGRTFSKSRLARRTYPSRIIRWALQFFGQGNNIDEIQRLINRKFKVKVGRSTIHRWLNEQINLVPINRWKSIVRQYDQLLLKQSFFHENLEYLFQMHCYKTDRLVKKQFPTLYKYLLGFKSGCPDAFFEIGERCSQPKFDLKIEPKKITNLACKMASFAVHARKNNRERHELVENFMIINDKATIACEVPVWYWEKSIDSGITGHIDILQLRNDKVYILDYKPRAAKDKKAAQQLYHYAAALSFRAKVPFEKIMCAWFDEQDYFEYSPNDAKARLKRFN